MAMSLVLVAVVGGLVLVGCVGLALALLLTGKEKPPHDRD